MDRRFEIGFWFYMRTILAQSRSFWDLYILRLSFPFLFPFTPRLSAKLALFEGGIIRPGTLLDAALLHLCKTSFAIYTPEKKTQFKQEL